ncbi:YhcN/YlaJ family sporulation lipoprotein [Bacillus sp. FJAT-27231]|uniref:YhcN/YlaJ family sporulation lipoprotein n=1 Tax=Bacillus sp. FJAT-27231 TaxID=1679168 RepID=UPI000670F463|nr:YhcN/YlaJ family sporulation lipoprotein [Bacillus sp. FJAT-27231]
MKKPLLTVGVASFLMMAGCNANDTNNLAGDGNNRDRNTINVADRYDRDRYDMYNGDRGNGVDGRIGGMDRNDRSDRGGLMTNNRQDGFGYVRHQKGTVRGQSVSSRNMHVLDRERTADTIGRLSLDLPKVNDASVLVTDQEVLIAYNTDAKDAKDRRGVAEQVKRTALSVVPSWYRVYLTDDTDLRRDIENIAQTNGGMDVARDSIGRTVKLMKQNSPQGYTKADRRNNQNGGMNGSNGMNNNNGTIGNKGMNGNESGTSQKTGTPQTTGTPGTNWTTGPDDQDHTPGRANPFTNGGS